MRSRDLSLARNPKQGKEDDHRTTACSKPERTSEAIAIADK
jgi:hypothetical protein